VDNGKDRDSPLRWKEVSLTGRVKLDQAKSTTWREESKATAVAGEYVEAEGIARRGRDGERGEGAKTIVLTCGANFCQGGTFGTSGRLAAKGQKPSGRRCVLRPVWKAVYLKIC
jgi:hypothetical protein